MVEVLLLFGLEHAKYILLCLINENGFLFLSVSMLLDHLLVLSIFLEENGLDKIIFSNVSQALQWQCSQKLG